jgi:hypothetical protein
LARPGGKLVNGGDERMRMNRFRLVRLAFFGLVALGAAFFVWWDVLQADSGACARGLETEHFEKALSALEATVDLGLTLSTTLAGVGAALLMGMKSGIQLTPTVRFLLLIAVLFFAQSALAAVLWRFEVANLWVNSCVQMVAAPDIQARYQAHFKFFMLGLIALALLVFGATFRKGMAPLRGANP